MTHRADALRWLAEHESALANQYERAFVLDVLARTPELNINSVKPQHGFLDLDGRQRFCDFVIEEGEYVRIAIEIDGFDKSGRGRGMSHAEFLDWQRRHASLVSQGWNVIRFANSDVTNNPATCITLLSRLLRHVRVNSAHIGSLSDSVRKLEIELRSATTTAQDISGIRAKIGELQELILGAKTACPIEPPAASRILIGARSEPQSPKEGIYRKSKQRSQWPLALSLLAVASLLVVLLFSNGHKASSNKALNATDTEIRAISNVENTTLVVTHADTRSASDDSCVDDGSWTSAHERIGTPSFLAGPVHRITFGENVKGRPTWIEIGNAGRSNGLTVLIWGSHRDRFLPHLNHIQVGQVVCASGVVSEYNGRPQMIIRQPFQLSLGAP